MLPEYPPEPAEPAGMAKTFRETMWFKLGEQESQPQAVEQDGDEAEPSATVTVMTLPIEDRYRGDVSAADTAAFGLHTGMTDRMKALRTVAITEDDATMKSLVREMKSAKRAVLVGAGAAVLCTVFALYLI